MTAGDGPSRTALLAAETLGSAPAAARLAALVAEPVLVAAGPGRARTRRGQVMLATATSLLGRLGDFAPTLRMDVGSARVVEGVPPLTPGRPLAAELLAMLHAIAPRSARQHAAGGRRRTHALAFVVGEAPAGLAASEVVAVDGEGWCASAGRAPDPLDPMGDGAFNPMGPLVAAALGAALVARALLRRLATPAVAARLAAPQATVRWDLWSHAFDARAAGPPVPDALGVGRVAMVGLGALGAAAAWALAHLERAHGTIELVDDDLVAPTNLERVLTAFATDVGQPKPGVAARWLPAAGLEPVPVAARWGDAPPAGVRATTLVAGVDSGAARRVLARQRPCALYHGGTQGSELLVSRHVDGAGPCLECLYPDTETAARVHPCGRARFAPELPEATVGFVSALCGFLMACELLKDRLESGSREGPLDAARQVLRLDPLFELPGPFVVEGYLPRRDCPCRTSRP